MPPAPPFSYTYTPNIPELLQGLNCSVAISTYQTGKVVIFSAKDENQLVQLPRTFLKPMGMAKKGNKWAIATNDSVVITVNAPGLATNYAPNPNVYDSLYIPRASYYTGPLDMHDIQFTNNGLLGVNTMFSNLCEIDEDFSFKPIWKPSFISALKPEDRCHLNGLAIEPDTCKPKYITALGKGDSHRSWKEGMLNGGILIDIETDEIVLSELPVPHTPRIFGKDLFMLLSATGELVKVNAQSGTYDIITQLNGFARGMDRIGDYLFIATSKLRPNSSLFKEAPVAKRSVNCGITVVYLPTGQPCGYINYQTSVEELYDLILLEGNIRPNILNLEKGMHRTSVVTEEEVFWNNPELETQPETATTTP
ncbi:TIGR03032 family protein [Ekhidna sp.]|uniref:TIGR03032 family protein n=1 Tax=Ekhidna sp. TaxID=2608089 RepID=UPI0032987A9E